MRVISIRPAWAYAIIHMGRPFEVRTWRTHHRGPLLIHASASVAGAIDDAKEIKRLSGWKIPEILDCGAIVGRVTVVDCVPSEKINKYGWTKHLPSGLWCWVFVNPCACTPFDCKGKLGFWEFDEGKLAW